MTVAEFQISRKLVLVPVAMLGVVMLALNGAGAEMIQWYGILAIVVCILGRTWASLYIGGRKNNTLVLVGPYSVARNPLYFFSILGAAGAGMQSGSATVGLIMALLVWLVFYFEALHEERELAARHGVEYGAYKASVPRFLPNPRLWRNETILTVNRVKVFVTFAESALFFLSIPLAEAFEQLQSGGFLPVLIRLP